MQRGSDKTVFLITLPGNTGYYDYLMTIAGVGRDGSLATMWGCSGYDEKRANDPNATNRHTLTIDGITCRVFYSSGWRIYFTPDRVGTLYDSSGSALITWTSANQEIEIPSFGDGKFFFR